MIGRQAMSSDPLMKRNSWIVVAVGTLFDIAFCFVVALIFFAARTRLGFFDSTRYRLGCRFVNSLEI